MSPVPLSAPIAARKTTNCNVRVDRRGEDFVARRRLARGSFIVGEWNADLGIVGIPIGYKGQDLFDIPCSTSRFFRGGVIIDGPYLVDVCFGVNPAKDPVDHRFNIADDEVLVLSP